MSSPSVPLPGVSSCPDGTRSVSSLVTIYPCLQCMWKRVHNVFLRQVQVNAKLFLVSPLPPRRVSSFIQTCLTLYDIYRETLERSNFSKNSSNLFNILDVVRSGPKHATFFPLCFVLFCNESN